MLLAATARSGNEDISKTNFHRLLFLSNALAPVYDATPPSHLIMKYVRGPFYPSAQWDLDRMAVQGIVQAQQVISKPDKHGAWTSALYRLSPLGFDIVKKAIDLPTVAPIWEFLLDLAVAYSHIDSDLREEAVLKDRTYDLPGKSNKSVINFELEEDNNSLSASNTFVELAPEWLKPGRQDRLRMYLKYLELRVA